MGTDRRYGDVDRDGAPETVVSIGCYTQGGSLQLLAFDRDERGRIITLGTVVATTGPLRNIDDTTVRIASSGQITVRMADYAPCCGDQTPTTWQYRTYGWTGRAFRQTGARPPSRSTPRSPRPGVAPGTLVFGPAVGGTRHGTLTLTVTYLYGAVPDHLTLEFQLPADVAREGKTWPRVNESGPGVFTIDPPTPAAGTSTSYTFAFSRSATGADGDFGVYPPLSKQDGWPAGRAAGAYRLKLQLLAKLRKQSGDTTAAKALYRGPSTTAMARAGGAGHVAEAGR